MPEEIEVPLDDSQDRIQELHRARHLQHKEDEKEEGGKTEWTRLIGVSTALLAVLAAIGSLVAGRMVNEALLAKNDQVLAKNEQVGHLTKASDAWNYYQAEGLKSLIYKTSGDSLPPTDPRTKEYDVQSQRYKAKQIVLQDEAKDLEKQANEESKSAEKESKTADRFMGHHEVFAVSVSLCQIAIGLSAVAALTRRRRIWFAGLAAGLVGAILLLCGFLPHFKLPF